MDKGKERGEEGKEIKMGELLPSFLLDIWGNQGYHDGMQDLTSPPQKRTSHEL